MNHWGEGRARKRTQEGRSCWDWDKPQSGTSVYIYLYILHVIKFKLIPSWDNGGLWKMELNKHNIYTNCCSFGFGLTSVMLQFVWPINVFWYLAFSLADEKVEGSESTAPMRRGRGGVWASAWKRENGGRNVTFRQRGLRQARAPGSLSGLRNAEALRARSGLVNSWSRSICLNVDHVHWEAKICRAHGSDSLSFLSSDMRGVPLSPRYDY